VSASPILIRKGANKVEVVFLVANKRTMTFSFYLILAKENGKKWQGGFVNKKRKYVSQKGVVVGVMEEKEEWAL
jgi:hypothetical protein